MTKFSVGLGTLDKHSSVSDSLTFNVLMNSTLNFFWKNVKAMAGISYNLTFVFKQKTMNVYACLWEKKQLVGKGGGENQYYLGSTFL